MLPLGAVIAMDASTTSQTVRFGAGIRHTLASEIARLGRQRALLLSTSHQQDVIRDMSKSLGPVAAGIYANATMHTPVAITEDALRTLSDVDADCLVAVGGGSTTGLAKALSLRTGLPQIIIPTTYAGSEATQILGQTEDGVKTTMTDPRLMPDVVLYDPELVTTLPVPLSVASGLNAMAHAVEALYAEARTPDVSDLAISGFAAFAQGLPRVVADPTDLDAREATLRGAWSCGAVLGKVGMALHHKLCHTLGGMFDLPHAETHAIILPHATHYNALAAAEELLPITKTLGGDSPGRSIWQFSKSLNAPLALKSLGVSEDDLDKAADLAVTKPYWNPRAVTRTEVRSLLQDAWSGAQPGSA